MNYKKEEFFKSFPVSVKGFFLNQYDSIDSGKNYLIPIYQRRYVWDSKLVRKLIEDIKERSEKKAQNNSSPYFIGGIVLCRELTQLSEPYMSLEVIDGQQRLTTLSIIIASIYNQLKYHKERNFDDKSNWVNNQTSVIENLLFLTKEIPGTFEIDTGLTIERSDELHEVYSDILIAFKNGTFSEKFSSLNSSKRYDNISAFYCQRIINAAILVDTILTSYDDYGLLEFCSQLLDLTYLVVTKTIDIDTGFLVFEKLNDSGASLEPEDLLKSYLFSSSSAKEFDELSKEWKKLIDLIEKINPGKANISPREFLDNYLIVNGLEPGDMDKTKIFKAFKNHFNNSDLSSGELVEDLIKIAQKYKDLKHDKVIKKYINALNFKLGYLILLTYYSKLGNEKFNDYKLNILSNLIRLEFAYLLSGNSKKLGSIVKEICFAIVSSPIESLNEVDILIESKIFDMKNEFRNYLQTANLYTKKKASKLLLEILHYHIRGIDDVASYKVLMLTNEKWTPLCSYHLTEDEYPLYKYRLGNLTLVPKDFNLGTDYCYEEGIREIIENSPSEFSIQVHNDNTFNWGKDTIDYFSRRWSGIASEIFINGDFDKKLLEL